jgi:hypothetical protein
MVEAGRPTPAQNPSEAAARKGNDVEIHGDSSRFQSLLNLHRISIESPTRRGRARDPLSITERCTSLAERAQFAPSRVAPRKLIHSAFVPEWTEAFFVFLQCPMSFMCVQNELKRSNRLQPILAMSLGLQPQAEPDTRNAFISACFRLPPRPAPRGRAQS